MGTDEVVAKTVIASVASGAAATSGYVFDVTGLPLHAIGLALIVGSVAGAIHSLRLLDQENVPMRLFMRDVAYGAFAAGMTLFLIGAVHEVRPDWPVTGPWGSMFLAGIGGWLGKPWLDALGRKTLERYK